MALFDVDGVLTDGTLYLDAEGEKIKAFNAKDGFATALLRAHGLLSGIVSGKTSGALLRRARDLQFDLVITGAEDKVASVSNALIDKNVFISEVAYTGDDVNDLPLVDQVGRFYAPRDAHPLVLREADIVIPLEGGRGVARAVVEHILMSSGMTMDEIYEPLRSGWGSAPAAQ